MKTIKTRIKNLLDNDVLMFKLSTAFKFTFITAIFAIIAFSLTYLLLKIDLIFFESHGYPLISKYQDAYLEFVFSNLWDMLPWFLIVMVSIFVSGYYIAIIMMRPFKHIGIHCEERVNNQTRFYDPDFLSDLNLLTSFSSYFFSIIDQAKIKGKLEKIEIPADYTNIHKPIIERNFFINYLFIIIVFALIASLGIFVLNNEIRTQIMAISANFIKGNNQVKFFLEKQAEVENTAVWFLLSIHLIVNFIFGLHLYDKIASPAFAVFATLRSFLKGNYHNRIHLIGFYYLRNDCRKINKYLDTIQKDLT